MRPFGFVASVVVVLLLDATPVRAQQPFYTDDADVTAQGRFHLEFSDQFNYLQRSARPARRQNTADFEVDYGVLNGLELGLESPLLTIVRVRRHRRRTVTGIGDTNIGLKYKFNDARPDSPWPTFAATLNVEFPTGDTARGLGSGLTDVYLNTIAQKTITERTVFRLNGGLQFVGDQTTGAIGTRQRGFVFTGGGSLIHHFTDALQLGVEATGADAPKFRLHRGQLQIQGGGNYEVWKGVTLDFGIIRGFEPASPRIAFQLGFSADL